MIIVGNIITIVMLCFYTVYLVRLFLPNNKKYVVQKNIRLNELRQKNIKSIEEQKEFIDLKYPKKGKFKFRWIMIIQILLYVLMYSVIYYFYSKLFFIFNIKLSLIIGLLFVTAFPIILNLILKKFKLQNNDLLDMF